MSQKAKQKQKLNQKPPLVQILQKQKKKNSWIDIIQNVPTNAETNVIEKITYNEQTLKNNTNPNSTYIEVEIKIKGFKPYKLHAYIDTGASICCATKNILPNEKWVTLEKPIKVKIADNSIILIEKAAKDLDVTVAGKIFRIPTLYQQETGIDILIGNNFLNTYRPFIQDLEHIVLHTLEEKEPVHISKVRKAFKIADSNFLEYYRKRKRGEVNIDKPKPTNISSESIVNHPYDIYLQELETGHLIEEDEKIFITNLEQSSKIEKLLDQCCSENPMDAKIVKNPMTSSIILTEPSKVIRVRPMSYTPQDREEFSKQIKELLDLGVIEPSTSPHSSPAFLVENHSEIKRGKRRMVINYKELNKFTIDDGYFLPHKDQLLARIRGKTYYSGLDCKSGFWQVRLDDESKLLTAFSCPQGQYQWKVVPFGLKQAPGIFQRFMDNYFKPLGDYCCVYVDDILIYSNTLEEHYKHLANVLQTCIDNGIIISRKKATIAQKNIQFLGLEIELGKHKLQPHILEGIQKFPSEISDKTQLQRFLGCLTYAEGYIKKLAEMRKPLQAKLKKDVPWKWISSDTEYVNKVKKQIINLPALYHPLPSDHMIIETDASGEHWGAALKAKTTDSEELCRYTSGGFQGAELNYHSNEKEYLAVKKAITKFRIYVIDKEFTVRCDNKNFGYFLRTNIAGDYKQGRLIRWQQWFNHYKFKVEFIEGKKNCLADALTRELADDFQH